MTTIAAQLQRVQVGALILAGGVALGLSYTLSPLTVLSLGVLLWATTAASRGLTDGERRWFWSIVSISIAIRLIAIAALFYTADPSQPFASFFGDEELYKFRTLWLRNIGAGLPMAPADVIYSFDEVGNTSYIYVLAYAQALVGDAPYGLHVMNATLYMCAILALYKIARGSYGGVVAMTGLILLLFLPSLALWSVSMLKEPMSVFMIVTELLFAIAIVRAPRWWQKLLAVLLVIATAMAMETLRTGGMLMGTTGTIGGLLLVFVLSRGRRLLMAVSAAPFVILIALNVPAVQDRLLSNLRLAAFYHAGHVLTPGYSYRLVDSRYYVDRLILRDSMPPDDVGRFAVKAVWSYFVQPLPWEMKSLTLRAYLPEQIAWYAMVLLLPFGIYAGLKRDVVLTSMLAAHAAAAILIVALSSGNSGTLIRHRALALPYVVWLSATGAHDIFRRAATRRAARFLQGNGEASSAKEQC